MISIREGPEEAILFVGALFSNEDIFNSASQFLTDNFGNILYQSPLMPWDYTDYYMSELQPPIFRSFIFFGSLIDPLVLVEVKHITHAFEVQTSKLKKRMINLDPGYMTLAKVVLGSKKNYSHRMYLGKGVFGEVELFFKDGRFNPFFYTYSDYKDEKFLDIFMLARDHFRKKLLYQKKDPAE
ncbi:MAG: DUF4416 family protein [Nitrospirae bacterium]|nr:DUF4416 family protein [Nitrospirota bacterium]